MARVAKAGREAFLLEHGKENGRHPKEFHVVEHLDRMEKRANVLADVFGLSELERANIYKDIQWHDVIIEYDVAGSDFLTMITRRRGALEGDIPCGANGNEGRSALEMDKTTGLEKSRPLTKQQRESSKWAVYATYPLAEFGKKFDQFPFLAEVYKRKPNLRVFFDQLKQVGFEKGDLFSQPHLEKPLESGSAVPREVLITALVDLGGAGMSDAETFFSEGNAEMRELYDNLRNPSVFQDLYEGPGRSADRERVAAAFLKWIDSQAGFAAWQYLRFEKIVYLLAKNKQLTRQQERGLRSAFGKFQTNIRASMERAKRVRAAFGENKSQLGEQEAFKILAREVGYKID